MNAQWHLYEPVQHSSLHNRALQYYMNLSAVLQESQSIFMHTFVPSQLSSTCEVILEWPRLVLQVMV